MDGKQTEEDYLHEMLAMLQESHAKAAKPYIDRLVAIQAIKPPEPIFVTVEQSEALVDPGKKDAERLEWLMRNVSGAEFRRLGVLYGGNCDRDRIDVAMTVLGAEVASK